MPRLKIIYIASLLILSVLIGFTLFKPMATGGEYRELQGDQLLQTEDEWIIQFNIVNHEGKEQSYAINTWITDKPYSHKVLIPDGGVFTYIHHIYKDEITQGELRFAVYKKGEDTPFQQGVYHLK